MRILFQVFLQGKITILCGVNCEKLNNLPVSRGVCVTTLLSMLMHNDRKRMIHLRCTYLIVKNNLKIILSRSTWQIMR